MNCFVINLDRAPERMEKFREINPHLAHINRSPAVEGKSIDRGDLVKRGIFAEPILYSDGAIGNALSHMRLWEQAIADDDFVTVFEDDAIVHKDFEMIGPQLIDALPADWDVMVWGWNFDTVLSFDLFPDTACNAQFAQSSLRKHWQSIQQGAVRPTVHRLHYAMGTIGYSISAAGAKKLKQLALPLAPFCYKVPAFGLEIQNEAMDCVMGSLYGRLNAYVNFPPLIFTRNDRTQSSVLHVAKEEGLERGFTLTPTDFSSSRKFKRKQARYLFAKGDILGGARWYLKYLATKK